MSDRLHVLLAVPLSEGFVERVTAIDPRIDVHIAPPDLRRWLRDELGDDPGARARAEREAAEHLDTADVLIGWPRMPRACMERATRLRWVQSLSAGIDRLDRDTFAGITITNASGVAAVAMAEYVIGAMLLFAKGFPTFMRRQQAREWDRRTQARELAGATCGIVGMGAIGGETARRAKAMEMRVVATRRSPDPRPTDQFADELMLTAELPRLLEQSDYVVLAAPLTPETRGMIGRDELAAMRRSAVLVNVGRGPLVDERALIEALQDGTIAGAALDVFEREPLAADSPLWELENVFITPHVSAGSQRYDERAADLVAENLRRYLAGESLHNVVDIGRGY